MNQAIKHSKHQLLQDSRLQLLFQQIQERTCEYFLVFKAGLKQLENNCNKLY